MERMLSKKQAWLKQVRLTKDDNLYVGIDAHKKSLHVALFLNNAPAIDFVMPPDSAKLIDTLNKPKTDFARIIRAYTFATATEYGRSELPLTAGPSFSAVSKTKSRPRRLMIKPPKNHSTRSTLELILDPCLCEIQYILKQKDLHRIKFYTLT